MSFYVVFPPWCIGCDRTLYCMYGHPRLLPLKPVCFRRDIFRLSREIRRTCENCWRQGSRHIFAHGARRHRVDVVRHCSAHARSLSRPLEGNVRFEWFSSAQWAQKWAVVFQTTCKCAHRVQQHASATNYYLGARSYKCDDG